MTYCQVAGVGIEPNVSALKGLRASHYTNRPCIFVGMSGFEPESQEPESCILPLYYTPIVSC